MSTGFAAFVISTTATETGSGNIVVGAINDASLTITLNSKENLGNFYFDADKEDVSGRIYKSTEEGAHVENLTVTIGGTIANADHLGSLTIKVEQVVSSEVAAKADASVTKAAVAK